MSTDSKMLFSLLSFFAMAIHVVNSSRGEVIACSCSSGFIPILVDVTISVDPSNPNSTETFRLQKTFEVYSVLCEPVSADSKYSHAVQLLLHGQTYTSQYWDVTWGGSQNYSYVAHSCSRGISSFAYDGPGAGRSRFGPSIDVQMPTSANLLSSLARDPKSRRVSGILTGREKKYQKVVGFGHSLGSLILNHAAIVDGARSPFDGLVLTGMIHDPQFLIHIPGVTLPASEVDPVRWPNLDPGYITTLDTSARLVFYRLGNSSFSLTLFQLDELTKDVGSKWFSAQFIFSYKSAFGFKAPVVELVGSFDQIHCLPSGHPCDQAELQISEAVYWPDSKNFMMVVIEGYGHDVNLEFGATDAFLIMTQLFQRFVD